MQKLLNVKYQVLKQFSGAVGMFYDTFYKVEYFCYVKICCTTFKQLLHTGNYIIGYKTLKLFEIQHKI